MSAKDVIWIKSSVSMSLVAAEVCLKALGRDHIDGSYEALSGRLQRLPPLPTLARDTMATGQLCRSRRDKLTEREAR